MVTAALGWAGVTALPSAGPAQSAPAADRATSRYTEADVQFMRGMIAHHGQAVEMAALVPDHTRTAALRSLAKRIDVSQKDEIKLMQRWLEDRHEGVHHDGMAHDVLMPGMLTTEEMAELAAAKGNEFDRLFLKGMIKHHEGALTMVATLFATQGSGQEVEIFRFASEVDADQRAEIKRMTTLLNPRAKRP